MTVTIYLVRHAESLSNVTGNGNFHDPELTTRGHRESAALGAKLSRDLDRIDMIFASPMQRAIQTALGAFPDYMDEIILLPELQERGGTPCAPCDIGSPPDLLLSQYGAAHFDYSHMTLDWTDKGPGSFYAPSNAPARARSVRRLIREVTKPFEGMDACVVVVTHGRFLQFLTESDVIYGNAEARPYVFAVANEGDTEARLIPAFSNDADSLF
ncbi:phosphoglycerate mutase-like protein [Xylaria venustula]|nr:phosphoglycerate mutase-like protein [Xylaria venustula]